MKFSLLIVLVLLTTNLVFSKDQLCCGQEIPINGRIESANHHYFLVFQNDGNLVLYKRSGVVLWSSNTNGWAVTRCVMQADGNLVLFNEDGPIWTSKTDGYRNSRLILQNDGNLVIYRTNNTSVWETKTAQTPVPQNNERCCDDMLGPEGKIESMNHQYYLILQGDGNLVLYKSNGIQLWASNTEGIPATRCVMQTNGNLVLFNGDSPTWSTNTDGHPDSRLVMQDDGNLVIYLPNGISIWDTQTSGR